MSTFLRTQEMKKRYQEHRRDDRDNGQCALCSKLPLQDFTHWKLVDNAFPYDVIAQRHHMIIPKRHVTEENLTQAELDEFARIKRELIHPSYDYIIEASTRGKSIPDHHHLHLIVGKQPQTHA